MVVLYFNFLERSWQKNNQHFRDVFFNNKFLFVAVFIWWHKSKQRPKNPVHRCPDCSDAAARTTYGLKQFRFSKFSLPLGSYKQNI